MRIRNPALRNAASAWWIGIGVMTNRIRLYILMPTGLWIRIHLIRIRIQYFGLNADPDPDPNLDPIRIQGFYDQKTGNKNLQPTIFFYFFISKTTIYLSLGLHKERRSYKKSPELSKENNQHFKT
jgi:hypothetical protein